MPSTNELNDQSMARPIGSNYHANLEFLRAICLSMEYKKHEQDAEGLESGAISRGHVRADYYDLKSFKSGPNDITIFKNGGGAHLDLMTARYI